MSKKHWNDLFSGEVWFWDMRQVGKMVGCVVAMYIVDDKVCKHLCNTLHGLGNNRWKGVSWEGWRRRALARRRGAATERGTAAKRSSNITIRPPDGKKEEKHETAFLLRDRCSLASHFCLSSSLCHAPQFRRHVPSADPRPRTRKSARPADRR